MILRHFTLTFFEGGNHLETVNSGRSHILDGYLNVTSSPQIGAGSIFLTVVSAMFNKLLISRPTIAIDLILSTVCLDSFDAQAANRGGNCDTFSTVNPDNSSHHAVYMFEGNSCSTLLIGPVELLISLQFVTAFKIYANETT